MAQVVVQSYTVKEVQTVAALSGSITRAVLRPSPPINALAAGLDASGELTVVVTVALNVGDPVSLLLQYPP